MAKSTQKTNILEKFWHVPVQILFRIARSFRKRKWLYIVLAVLIAIVFIATLPFHVVQKGKYLIYTEYDEVRNYQVGIVFGAKVDTEGEPSTMLEDRLIVAAELYRRGKIEKILVSGDNRFEYYNEPGGMANYLMQVQNIPYEDVVLDFAGRRTYDTCVRAKEIFGIEKAILVTQGYHLPRALFLCNKLGVSSTGFSATRQQYYGSETYKTREIIAIYKAVVDAYFVRPKYVGGDPEHIVF